MNRIGKKGRHWREIRTNVVIPALNGIDYCEFGFPGCLKGIMLTPAHSRKRRKIENDEQLAEVAVCCIPCHRVLDEQMTHADMEAAVKKAIARRNQ
jgi:hypothetical protein